jgi:hypothetical protein
MARCPAFARRGGAVLESRPVGYFLPIATAACSQPSFDLSDPFLIPPDLPDEPLASWRVLGMCGFVRAGRSHGFWGIPRVKPGPLGEERSRKDLIEAQIGTYGSAGERSLGAGVGGSNLLTPTTSFSAPVLRWRRAGGRRPYTRTIAIPLAVSQLLTFIQVSGSRCSQACTLR